MPIVAIIRPGATEFDEQHRVQGSLDIPLSPQGAEQVSLIAERLRQIPLEVLLCPAAEPAASSAEVLSELLGVPVREIEGLENQDLGLWQGLQIEELRRKYPKAIRQHEELPATVCPPNGETVNDVRDRLEAALARPLRRYDVIGLVLPEPVASLARDLLLEESPQAMCPLCTDNHCGELEFVNTESHLVAYDYDSVATVGAARKNGL